MDKQIMKNSKLLFDDQTLAASGNATCSALSNVVDLSQSGGTCRFQWLITGPGKVNIQTHHSLDSSNFYADSATSFILEDLVSGAGVSTAKSIQAADLVKFKLRNTSASAVTAVDLWFVTE